MVFRSLSSLVRVAYRLWTGQSAPVYETTISIVTRWNTFENLLQKNRFLTYVHKLLTLM